MLTKLIDRMIEASLQRAQRRERVENMERQLRDAERLSSRPGGLVTATDVPPPTSRTRMFTVHDALIGSYIEFMKRRYNPHGADDYQREIYLVQPGESVIDAISTILVLTEK